MLGKFFNQKIEEKKEKKREEAFEEKLDKMDIFDISDFVKTDIATHKEKLQILKKLVAVDSKTNKRMLTESSSKTKVKVCCNVVIRILESEQQEKNIISACKTFLFVYSDIIKDNDKREGTTHQIELEEALFFATKKLSENDE